MGVTESKIKDVIINSIANNLEISVDEVHSEMLLTNDLEIDSIDIIEVLYEIEKQCGVVIELHDFATYYRGSLNPREFQDKDGYITNKGLEHLRISFPHAAIKEGITIRHIFELLRVEDFNDFVLHMSKQ